MAAIYKRELRAFFSSPIGYVFIAVILFFEGYFFYNSLFSQTTEAIVLVFSSLLTFGMMMIPVLTMKLMSEDKKQKTDQALLTAPVSLAGIVVGKFLAAFTVYGIAICFTLVQGFVMSFFGPLNWGIVFGNVIGTLLYGAATIAIGLFISGLTDSQMIAAIGGFGASILLILIDQVKYMASNEIVTKIVDWISFSDRYSAFTNGVFNFANVIFFLSVVGIFLFLSVSTLEKRRWS